MEQLREGEDYYLLPDGRLVMTAAYLRRRGWCCGNGCLNCPYDYEAVPEPKRSFLLSRRNKSEDHGGQDR
jgi:hypothetical protein